MRGWRWHEKEQGWVAYGGGFAFLIRGEFPPPWEPTPDLLREMLNRQIKEEAALAEKHLNSPSVEDTILKAHDNKE